MFDGARWRLALGAGGCGSWVEILWLTSWCARIVLGMTRAAHFCLFGVGFIEVCYVLLRPLC
jgi:hypothetical protein